MLVTAACSAVAATVCPWPPWQLRDPSTPPPLGPAPASSRPPTATKGKPHPRSPPGQGSVGARTAPHSLALEGYTPIPGGIRWSVCTLNVFRGTQYTFSSSFLFRTLWSSHTHNGPCPWGPRAPLWSLGGTRGTVGHKGRAYSDRPTSTRNQVSIITSFVLPHVITEQPWAGCL